MCFHRRPDEEIKPRIIVTRGNFELSGQKNASMRSKSRSALLILNENFNMLLSLVWNNMDFVVRQISGTSSSVVALVFCNYE